MNEHMKNEVTKNKSLESLRELAQKNGMVTLWSSCQSLVIKGITSIQELISMNAE